MEPWYDTIAGGHLWPVSIGGMRHFVSVDPLPGATTLCGQTAGEDYASATISTTCPICADAACDIRIVTPVSEPAPEEIQQSQSPLAIVTGLVGELAPDQQSAVMSVAQSLADGTLTPSELI